MSFLFQLKSMSLHFSFYAHQFDCFIGLLIDDEWMHLNCMVILILWMTFNISRIRRTFPWRQDCTSNHSIFMPLMTCAIQSFLVLVNALFYKKPKLNTLLVQYNLLIIESLSFLVSVVILLKSSCLKMTIGLVLFSSHSLLV